MKKIAISIGAFKARPSLNNYPSVEAYLSRGFTVVAYDPRKDVHDEYLKIKNKNFVHHQAAVVAVKLTENTVLKVIRGRALHWESKREGDWYMGSTLYCDEDYDFTESTRFSGVIDEYSVKVVSIRSILEKYKKIEELHLLCEGEEIPIIMKTPLNLLRGCRIIVSNFPWTYPHLHQTVAMERKCISKLSKCYNVTRQVMGNRCFKFVRKN